MNLPIPVVNTVSTSDPELVSPDTAHAVCKSSHKPKSQSALRLVKTKGLSRDEWLQA